MIIAAIFIIQHDDEGFAWHCLCHSLMHGIIGIFRVETGGKQGLAGTMERGQLTDMLLRTLEQAGVFKRASGLVGKCGYESFIGLAECIWSFAFNTDHAGGVFAQFHRHVQAGVYAGR